MIATRGIAVLCVGILIAQRPYVAYAQQPQAGGGTQADSQKALTPGQLDSLVAPIALYPDPILSQALVASTYPLEIVEAGRWVRQNPNLKDKALVDAAAKQPWDASVQALVALPEVLKQLDQDVSWTSDLGNAFLAQQQDVMDAIQRLRRKASDAGALKSTQQQTVTTATDNNQQYIEIQPASTQVVYVPQYNPEAVWGPPPDYYPYPPLYYPPSTGAIIAASAISFGAGMAIGAIWGGGGWNNWGWNAGWGHNNVQINNNFINNNHFNRTNVANGNNWVHNPAHRGGVPYNNRNVANRYQGAGAGAGARPNVGARPTAAQTQQRLDSMNGGRSFGGGQQGLNRPGGGQPGMNRPGGGPGGLPNQGNASRIAPQGGNQIGNRQMGAGGGNRGAFGGMSQGGARTQMNSNRGFQSRGGGGGFRGGGGGGMRGGGGRRR
jgi:Protein of unknown function (DUF3300)